MTRTARSSTPWIALFVLTTAASAHAQGAAVNHPVAWGTAVAAADQARLASGTGVGHPASPTWRAARANADHPAVQQAALATRVDANTFLVQPPAPVKWTLGPASDAPRNVAALR